MTAPLIIDYQDPGVPTLSGTEGSLAALLRYAAPLLGWDIIYDTGLIIVIRPKSYKGGQQLYYRFDDRAARGGVAPRIAMVQAYESMSDIDTGVNLVGPVYVSKSYYANTTGYFYRVVGDEFGFYLNCQLYGSGYASGEAALHYFGFLNSISNEVPMCCSFGIGTDGTSSGSAITYQCPESTASMAGMHIHKNNVGTLNTAVRVRSAGVFDLQGYGIGSLYKTSGWAVSDSKPLPSTINGQPASAPIYVNDGASYTIKALLPGFSKQTGTISGYHQVQAYSTMTGGWGYGAIIIPTDGFFRP